jgi:hypothetical protein
MQVKLWIILITGLLIYDTYHEHYYFHLFKTYKKYYKMAGIAIFGLGLYIMMNRGTNIHSASILNNFVKVLPIDKDSKDMITPFISNTQTNAIERIQTSGGKNKRSVSETKKKYVASMQNWKCGECQKQLPAWFEVDHTIRLDNGGTNEISNLVALCRDCHGKKTAMENML